MRLSGAGICAMLINFDAAAIIYTVMDLVLIYMPSLRVLEVDDIEIWRPFYVYNGDNLMYTGDSPYFLDGRLGSDYG